MQLSVSAASWMEIIAFRRRDRLIILPMTLLASIAGGAWVGPRFAIGWFAVNVAFMALSKALCDWIGARPSPRRLHETALAGFTFAMTLAYGALPVAMMVEGGQAGTIAGMAMIGAVALSSVSEFVISRLIGGAALIAVFLAALAAALWRPETLSWLHAGLVILSIAGFFGYVLQSAVRRERMQGQLRTALAAARSAEQAAENANAAKSAFLATMSHEIRTPLNGVLGMAQAMEGEELTQAQRERVAVIRQSGQTLTAILNDVLDLAKVEAGRLQLESIEFDLEDVLRAGRSAFAVLAARKGLEISLKIDEEARGRYVGDPTRLRQIVNNLMSNAVKFTDTGAVVVRAGQRDDRLVLEVSDSGAGIPADQLGQLFEKFVQLDASTTRRHGGTGLGLAICRDLCALMGGEISVESQPGRGTTFTVSLPLPRATERRDEPTVRQASLQGAHGGLRVLAAEDNAVNQLVLRTLLSQVGVDPVIVENGALAVEAWAEGDWDAVLMDVQMPVMDGLTALRKIREHETTTGRRRTPVIALTANAMVHQIDELRAAGMDAHVSKPIDVSQLFATLEAVLADSASDVPSTEPRLRRQTISR